MLPCVCSVIDHRRRQRVVRSVIHSHNSSHATFLFLPHFLTGVSKTQTSKTQTSDPKNSDPLGVSKTQTLKTQTPWVSRKLRP